VEAPETDGEERRDGGAGQADADPARLGRRGLRPPVAEEPAETDPDRRPQQRRRHLERDERRVSHAVVASQRPRHHAHGGDEASHHDRQRAVAREPGPRALHAVRGAERQPAVEVQQAPAAQPPAGEIPGVVRDEHPGRAQRDQQQHAGVARGGEGTGRHEHDPAGERNRGGVDQRAHEHDRVGVADQPGQELPEDLGHETNRCKRDTTTRPSRSAFTIR